MKPKQARGPARWTKQLRFDIEFAKRMVLEQGSCATILVVYPRGRASLVIRPSADLGKDTSARFLRILCTAIDAEAFAWISEAWMRRISQRFGETRDDVVARAYAVPPSEAEDRFEVVMAELIYRDDDGQRRCMADVREILRDATGKPVGFRDGVLDPLARSEGRWVEVLTAEPPTAEERARAAAAIEELGEMGVGLADMVKPS